MSISFNVIEKGQPGVVGGGEKKFYASPKVEGVLDIDALSRRIEKISAISAGDISSVLITSVDVIVEELTLGRSVQFGKLGNFRISISSEGQATAEEVTANSIKKARVIFTPGKLIKEMLTRLSYKRV
jgi:predicted histone-like DNA-binding protein